MNTFSKILWLAASVFIGLAGVYALMHPEAAILALATFIGWCLLFGGFLHAARYLMLPKEFRSGWFLVGAIIDILFGIYVLSANRIVYFAAALAFMFSLYLIVRGIITVFRFANSQFKGLPYRGLFILIGVLTAVVGVGLLIVPGASITAMAWLIGIGLLLSGMSSFVLLMDKE